MFLSIMSCTDAALLLSGDLFLERGEAFVKAGAMPLRFEQERGDCKFDFVQFIHNYFIKLSNIQFDILPCLDSYHLPLFGQIAHLHVAVRLLEYLGAFEYSFIQIIIRQLRLMAMLSENSFLSGSSSAQRSYIDLVKLQKIETDVFNRIVDLKNEKIELLSLLSQSIDRRYHLEGELRKLLQLQKLKEENMATSRQYKPAIQTNVNLKCQFQELQRQYSERANKINKMRPTRQSIPTQVPTKSRSGSMALSKLNQTDRNEHLSGQNDNWTAAKIQVRNHKHEGQDRADEEDQLIDQILQQRELTRSLAQKVTHQIDATQGAGLNHEEQIQSIRRRIQLVQTFIQKREQQKMLEKLSRTKTVHASQLNQSGRHQREGRETLFPVTHESETRVEVRELLKYIRQQEEEKKLLYQELNEFVEEMEALRSQNEEMRVRLGNRADSQ